MDFDRKVRAMLEDAQEKVPASVWKAVSAQMGHKRQASAWWRRAGWALAAAVLILGIVLFPRHSSPVEDTTPPIAQVTVVPQKAVELQDDVQTSVADARKPAIRQRLAVAATASDGIGIPAAAEQEENTEQGKSAEQAEASNHAGRLSDNPQKTVFTTFQAIPDEDEARKIGRRLSLQVKGAFATNKTAIQYGSSGRMGSPSIVTSGIEQTSESTFGIPFSAGIGARWYVSERLSVGTGVNYSLLTRKFIGNFHAPQAYEGTSINDADISHSLSYIGIPLNVYFDLVKRDPVGLYIFGGGEAERAVANNYHICKGPIDQSWSEQVSGLQWSTQIGIGVTFKITDFMSLYADPGVKLYFNSGQPQSIRTQQPIMFSAEIGLRFEFAKK